MLTRMLGIIVALNISSGAAPKSVQNYGFKVVSVETSSTGSGVFVDAEIFLTAAHVVAAGEGSAVIVECNGEEIVGKVIKHSALADLALISLPGTCPAAAVVHVADKNPEVGEDIRIVGFPRGWRRTVTKGIVSAYEIFSVEVVRFMMLVDAQVIGGNSGGPVLSSNKDLVGIVSSRLCLQASHDDEPPLCYTGVIPVTTIRNFLMQN